MLARPLAAVLLAVLPLAALPAAADAPPSVAEIVRRCVDAHGGAKVVARAAVVREEGTVTSILHPGAKGRIVRTYARPGRLRVEVAFPGEPREVRIVDGGRGWRSGEPVDGGHLVSMLLQAARMDLPALLSAWQARVQDRGTVRMDGGREVRVLALEVGPGVVVEAAIDPATGRILRSHGTARGAGGTLEFATAYGDWRRVDGLLVPLHEDNWANGRATGATVLERVELPDTIPDATFRP